MPAVHSQQAAHGSWGSRKLGAGVPADGHRPKPAATEDWCSDHSAVDPFLEHGGGNEDDDALLAAASIANMDLLDLSALETSLTSGLDQVSNEFGSKEDMLQALLSSLPEPPITDPSVSIASIARTAPGPAQTLSSPKPTQNTSIPSSPTAPIIRTERLTQPGIQQQHQPLSPPISPLLYARQGFQNFGAISETPIAKPKSRPELSVITNSSSFSINNRHDGGDCSMPDSPILKDFDYDSEFNNSSDNDIALVRQPSTLFAAEQLELSIPSLGTPASSRRNTDESRASNHHLREVQRLSSAFFAAPSGSGSSSGSGSESESSPEKAGLLAGEMPPDSPFFARVSKRDIKEARRTIRRASLSCASSLQSQRVSWCTPVREPVFASLRLQKSMNRASLPPTSLWDAVQSAAASGDVRVPGDAQSDSSSDSSDSWLCNQEPPISPIFSDGRSSTEDRHADRHAGRHAGSMAVQSHAGEDMALHSISARKQGRADQAERRFQVDVFSLLGSKPLAASLDAGSVRQVVVREVVCTQGKGTRLVPADAGDPDVAAALRRYPLLLALLRGAQGKADHASRQPTRMRQPSGHRSGLGGLRLGMPAYSFVVGSGRRAPADRAVRTVDVEKMVEAYLPKVYAQLYAATKDVDVSESESSASTLVEPGSNDDAGKSGSLGDKASKGATPAPSLLPKPTRIASTDRKTPGKLRAPTAMLDLRTVYSGQTSPMADIVSPPLKFSRPRSCTQSRENMQLSRPTLSLKSPTAFSQIATPRSLASAPPVTRRRSEVQQLISQANAVLKTTMRRSSAADASMANTFPKSASRIRAPRSSLPSAIPSVRCGPNSQRSPPGSARTPIKDVFSTQDPRSPSSSVFDQGVGLLSPSRAMSPTSGLRAPTSLASALNRYQHRLEPARKIASASEPALSLAPTRRNSSSIGGSTGMLPSSQTPSGIKPPTTSGPLTLSYSHLPVSQATVGRQKGGSVSLLIKSTPASLSAASSFSGIQQPSSIGRLRTTNSTSSPFRGPNISGLFSTPQQSQTRYSGMLVTNTAPPAKLSKNAAPYRRPSVRGIFNRENEFLTLRPVHTPDIIPRKIDPRLVERAMTPMLKCNVAFAPKNASSGTSRYCGGTDGTSNGSVSSIMDLTDCCA